MSNRFKPAQLDEIIRRAATDPVFRSRLLSDPAPALTEAFAEPLPQGVRLKFIEKPSGYDALIVLPDAVAARSELSDHELEAVAGGGGDTTTETDTTDTCGLYTCMFTCEGVTGPIA